MVRKGSPVADRKVYPKEQAPAHQLLWPTSPTGALALGTSRLQAVSPIGRHGPKRYFLLRHRDSDPTTRACGNPAHRSSPTGALRADWSHPTGGTPFGGHRKTCGERQGRLTSQNHCTRDHTLHETVLCSHPDTNSIVGADISPYSIVGAAKNPIR